MTVKELKDKLNNLPDDMEIVSYHHDMERTGIMPANFLCEPATFRKTRRETMILLMVLLIHMKYM